MNKGMGSKNSSFLMWASILLSGIFVPELMLQQLEEIAP